MNNKRFWIGIPLAVLALCAGVFAYTANSTPFPQTFQAAAGSNAFTNANGTTAQTVFTANATSGSVLYGLNVYSTDTATGTITLNYVLSATSYPILTHTVAIQAGNITGTPPDNLMSPGVWPNLPKDQYGNPVWYLPPGASLTCALSVAPTSGKVFTVVPISPQDY